MMIKKEKLLQSMTLEQKVAQLVQISYAHVSKEEAEEWAKKGVGLFLHIMGDEARHLQKSPRKTVRIFRSYSG